MTKEDLQAIRAIIQEELKPINQHLADIDQRLDTVNQRLGTIEESLEETRCGVNTLLEWAEDVGTSITFPLPKIAKIK